MRKRTRREKEEEEEPVSFTKGDSTLHMSCMENSKEKTRLSDSHEDPIPPSESLQMENSKQLVASDMSTKNGRGGGEIERSNNPKSSQSEIPKEASSKGASVEDCGREKLKRHRMEMAGQVWIPERWGQESLLKDWIDSAAFDRSLVPKGLALAREALVDECRRRANSGSLRIKNRC